MWPVKVNIEKMVTPSSLTYTSATELSIDSKQSLFKSINTVNPESSDSGSLCPYLYCYDHKATGLNINFGSS